MISSNEPKGGNLMKLSGDRHEKKEIPTLHNI
jgi:hypothetical protein